ncbi:RND family transporter [Saccharopolyspora erythraea]|uniref:MMPL/RND family transporter n=1 Tax=Saccharopolyspora erythraea TaxID=1836 RepID=UPI001BAB3A8B|nr:RND family transporter [Saccharopolyspora erythraea]QUG99407.1 RND family transporter [Saccharopolyspora erythraea]
MNATRSDERDGGPLARLSRFVVRRRGAVVCAWVALAALLNVLVPQLEAVIGQSRVPFVPDGAPSVRALPEMDRRFGGEGANSLVFVVMADEGGLSEEDHRYYAELVGRMERDDSRIASVQDAVSQPELADALVSRDGKAIYIPVGLRGENGSPETTAQIKHIRETAQQGRPDSLAVHVTGPMATIADMQDEIEKSMLVITAVTIGLITAILLVIYRSVVTALVALALIGLSLGTARAVTALCGLQFFDVSTFTASLLTAVVLGAGTDYGVFLLSRFHERIRAGDDPEQAVITANRRVAAVIAASAGTVIAACSGMALAEVSIFRTTGPAIAVSLAVTLAAGLTLTPALLAIAATRGWAKPRRSPENGRWTAIAERVVARPARVLAAGLVVLLLLAAFYPAARLSYDERAVQPAATDSNLGYGALGKHFPAGEILPEYVLVDSDHDMRNPQDLAALETAAANVAKVDGVRAVRGVTRPTGEPIAEANVGNQVGVVGDRLGAAEEQLGGGQQGIGGLADGAGQLADGTGRLAGGAAELAAGSGRLAQGARSAVDGADQLLNGLNTAHGGLGTAGDGADDAGSAATTLAEGARQLATGLDLARDQTSLAVDGLGLAYNALAADAVCTLDPICAQARKGIHDIYVSERDQLLPGLEQAAAAAHKIADGNGDLASGMDDLRGGIATARDGIARLAEGQRTMRDQLGALADGAGQAANGAQQLSDNAGLAADGAGQLRDGTANATVSVKELERGLAQAADFLRTVRAESHHPGVGGFYLPPNALSDPRMAMASGMFLSDDGRTARLVVLHSGDPLDRAAMDRAGEIVRTAEHALRGTSLDGSGVHNTGSASVNRDLARMSDADFSVFALVALLSVLVILMLLLRSIVAPIYLLLSVILSYAAAMGIAVLFWQFLLGGELDWSVQPIAFVILVAVGADYNMLLMSRIREESDDGSREGIARAVATTGGVITSAGVIFAASMFALMSGTVDILAQLGFTIGVGLLLDTFVVRTLVIPATAVLLRKWNWWPSRTAGERG